eukprot:IDg6132t1
MHRNMVLYFVFSTNCASIVDGELKLETQEHLHNELGVCDEETERDRSGTGADEESGELDDDASGTPETKTDVFACKDGLKYADTFCSDVFDRNAPLFGY